jgi:aspartate aminotransferase
MNISATLNCQNIIKQRINDGLPVYNFGLGANPIKQPDFYVHKIRQYAVCKSYTSSEGIPELNDTLLDMYSKNNYADKALVGNGLKELLFIVQSAFEGKIIHITPSWISYKEQITLLGKESNLIEIRTTIDNDYKLDLDQLEQILKNNKDHDKLIIFNNPNNPTGLVYTNEEVEHISKVLKKYKCVVLADEIYMNLIHHEKIRSMSDYIPELTIIGSSVSKDLGCGGYRLGWLVFPKEQNALFNRCNSYCSSIYSCASVPIQYATHEMLRNKDLFTSHCELSIKIYKYISNEICDILQSSRIRFIPPNSAWYLFLDFSEYEQQLSDKDIHTSYELSKLLVSEIGIVCVPGDNFNIDGLHLRFSLVDFEIPDMNDVVVEDIDITKMKEGIRKLIELVDSM